MERVLVTPTDGSAPYFGSIEGAPEVAQHPVAGQHTRLVIAREDNGTKVYVWPGLDSQVDPAPLGQVEAASAPPSLAHLAPGPAATAPPPSDPTVTVVGSGVPSAPMPQRQGTAPPVGSTFAGAPLPSVGPLPLTASSAAPPPFAPPAPTRFLVQLKKGSPSIFHTRSDCARVPNGSTTLPVDDGMIEFFSLTICQVCQRRESQVSWQEAIAEAVAEAPDGGEADAVVAKLKSLGFKVSPETVDRPRSAT